MNTIDLLQKTTTRTLRRLLLVPKQSHNAGLPPGTLVASTETGSTPPTIAGIRYNQEKFEENAIQRSQIGQFDTSEQTTWINVDGLGDVDLFRHIGDELDIHDLVLEDILNVNQRPKIDEHNDYLFVVLRMIYSRDGTSHIESEQVSFILKEGLVLSFQERQGDVFEGVRERIRRDKGRIRRMGADYLLYALMDAVVDNYFSVMEKLGDSIETLESEVIESPEHSTVNKLHSLRRKVILLRRAIWPLREVVGSLIRNESSYMKEETSPFLHDIYDHIIQVIETLESFRDLIGGMLEVYLSSVSNRMNEVMKVLTIISTVFIPLGFIAGVYGMNFAHMPELSMKWGYPAVLTLMLAVVAGFLFYFRRRRWI